MNRITAAATLNAVLVTVVTLVAASTFATADDDPPAGRDVVSWGISPAGADAPDQRPYIAYQVDPGSVVYDHVAVLNIDDQPIDLAVYTGDSVQGADGGLAVRTHQEQNLDAGRWIAVDGPGAVQVGPQVKGKGFGYEIVPVTMTIPPDAPPGDHVGAVVASLTSVGQGGAGSPALAFEQRVALTVYVRVAGRLSPGLVVDDLQARWQRTGSLGQGAVTVTYSLRNTGNVLYGVEPSVRVAGIGGLGATKVAGKKVTNLLPGGEVTQTVTVENVWALGPTTVTVDAKAVAPSTGTDPAIGAVRASTLYWAWPLLLLIVLVPLLGLMAWRVDRRRRWRRYYRQTGGDPRTGGSDPSGRDGGPGDSPRPAASAPGRGAGDKPPSVPRVSTH